MKNLFYILLIISQFLSCVNKHDDNEEYIINHLVNYYKRNDNTKFIFIAENECSSCAVNTIYSYIHKNKEIKYIGIFLYEAGTNPLGIDVLKTLPKNKIVWKSTTDEKILNSICSLTNTRGGVFVISYNNYSKLSIEKIG